MLLQVIVKWVKLKETSGETGTGGVNHYRFQIGSHGRSHWLNPVSPTELTRKPKQLRLLLGRSEDAGNTRRTLAAGR
jgi:hypothetical protein